MEQCVLCNQKLIDGQEVVCLKEKGSDGINKASEAKGDVLSTLSGQSLHVVCRRDYVHKRNIPRKNDINNNDITPLSLRSADCFDFKSRCLFCTRSATVHTTKRGYDVFPVRSLDFQRTVHKICVERGDQWANDVLRRLSIVIDLLAAAAVYHQTCNVNFRTGRQIPKYFQDTEEVPIKKSNSRHSTKDQTSAFAQIIDIVTNSEDEVVSITDLVQKMAEICGENAYSSKHMKRKLIEHFGHSIVISNVDGKSDKMTFNQTAASIIEKFYKRSKAVSSEEEKINIIAAAAKLIKNDISLIESSQEFYPSFQGISSVDDNKHFLPDSLQLFKEKLVYGKDNSLKVAAIGQAIAQACRPKAIIAPLQIGLAVQLHHHFGSRFLIETLNSLGFTSSYWEVQKYETSAAAVLNTSIPEYFPGRFLQFIADNVDHNVRTIDGHNTFHGMGIIACTSPGSSVHVPIPRLDVSSDELAALGKNDVKYFKDSESKLPLDTFLPLDLKCETEEAGLLLDNFTNIIWPMRQ